MRDQDGLPVAGACVWFEAELREGFSPVANAVTDRNGGCSVRLRVRRGRRYRARFLGTADRPEAVSTPASVVVIPRIEARLTQRSVAAGSTAVVVGEIRPRKRFVRIEAQRQLRGGRWAPLATHDVPLVSGEFEAGVPLETPGIYRLRVWFGGDGANADAVSPWLTVQAA